MAYSDPDPERSLAVIRTMTAHHDRVMRHGEHYNRRAILPHVESLELTVLEGRYLSSAMRSHRRRADAEHRRRARVTGAIVGLSLGVPAALELAHFFPH